MKANIMGKKHNYVKTKFYCRSRSDNNMSLNQSKVKFIRSSRSDNGMSLNRSRSNLSEGENQNVIYHLTSGSDKKKVMILFKCCFLGG